MMIEPDEAPLDEDIEEKVSALRTDIMKAWACVRKS